MRVQLQRVPTPVQALAAPRIARPIRSAQLRFFFAASKREEEEEEGGEKEGEGEGDAAVHGRRRERVKKTQLSYQLHRDVNAAWNLWEVCVAQYFGHPRPGYLRAHTAA